MHEDKPQTSCHEYSTISRTLVPLHDFWKSFAVRDPLRKLAECFRRTDAVGRIGEQQSPAAGRGDAALGVPVDC